MDQFVEPQSHCLAGVARCDITPPVGIYHRMWGAAKHDRSTGIHRPLTGTILYLKDHAKQQAPMVVIALDHCLLWSAEMNALLASLAHSSGLPPSSLNVFFSHTHGAGLMGKERTALPGGELIKPYLERMTESLCRCLQQAKDSAVEATVMYATGHCDLAAHRDFHDSAREMMVCGFNPEGPVDDTVLVGKVVDASQKTLATIVNYACHPTTLAWDNTLISPDYVGSMREVIECQTNAPCVFIQGASGDVGPREGFVGDVEVAERNGRQLGFAALAAFESIGPAGSVYQYAGPVISGATIGTWKFAAESNELNLKRSKWQFQMATVELPYRSDLPSKKQLDQEFAHWMTEEQKFIQQDDRAKQANARAMIERATRTMTRVDGLPEGSSYPYSIPIWKVGDAIWVAFNGELYNVLQRALRERFPDTPIMIGTLANGSSVWYLPDQASYGLGLYQEDVSILASGCLEKVISAAAHAIEQLLQRS